MKQNRTWSWSGAAEVNLIPVLSRKSKLVRLGLVVAMLVWTLLSYCLYSLAADMLPVDCSKVEEYECKMLKWIKAFRSGKYADNDEIARKVHYFQ